MDDSEIDVDIDVEDITWQQLREERGEQLPLEPFYEEGEEEETDLEEEAEENEADISYTVYYQE